MIRVTRAKTTRCLHAEINAKRLSTFITDCVYSGNTVSEGGFIIYARHSRNLLNLK